MRIELEGAVMLRDDPVANPDFSRVNLLRMLEAQTAVLLGRYQIRPWIASVRDGDVPCGVCGKAHAGSERLAFTVSTRRPDLMNPTVEVFFRRLAARAVTDLNRYINGQNVIHAHSTEPELIRGRAGTIAAHLAARMQAEPPPKPVIHGVN
jgi:hypothetical protein